MPHSILVLLFSLIVTFTLLPQGVLNLAPGVPYTPQELKAAREAGLKWHNTLRKWHNTTSMMLDDKLNEAAQSAANHLVAIDKMEHTSTGENLYTARHSGNRRFDAIAQIESATKAWYFEICDTKNWPTGQLNHFTQVVWVESVKLGLGVATDKDNSVIYVVGRYDPVGNYVGEYDTGVKKLVCKKTAICNGMRPKATSEKSDNCLENKKGPNDMAENEVEEKAGKKSGAAWGWNKSSQFFVLACSLGVIHLHIFVRHD